MGIFKPKVFILVSLDLNLTEPSSMKQVLCSSKQKALMQAEFDALVKNNTWVLVPIPKDRQIVGNK